MANQKRFQNSLTAESAGVLHARESSHELLSADTM